MDLQRLELDSLVSSQIAKAVVDQRPTHYELIFPV